MAAARILLIAASCVAGSGALRAESMSAADIKAYIFGKVCDDGRASITSDKNGRTFAYQGQLIGYEIKDGSLTFRGGQSVTYKIERVNGRVMMTGPGIDHELQCR